jgi:dipeptidase E
MKLYLSSYRVPTPSDLAALLPKPLTECRTAIIPNAKDYQLPELRAQKTDELSDYLNRLGMKSEVVDLRDYDSPEQLKTAFVNYDLIWANGGNTFVLRSEMHRSGFDQIINGLLADGKVYGGESAGAIVAGVTLEGFEIGDDPDETEEVLWEGLGLTDKIIAPHIDNPDFIEYTNHIKKLYATDSRIIYLGDRQAFVVNGTEHKIVTTP